MRDSLFVGLGERPPFSGPKPYLLRLVGYQSRPTICPCRVRTDGVGTRLSHWHRTGCGINVGTGWSLDHLIHHRTSVAWIRTRGPSFKWFGFVLVGCQRRPVSHRSYWSGLDNGPRSGGGRRVKFRLI